MDGLLPDEYTRQKKLLELELAFLIVPGATAAEEVGKLLLDLPKLWGKANLEEQRKLLLTMLDAVCVDAEKTNSIVAVKSKPSFRPVF